MKKLFIVVNVDWFFLSHRKEIAIMASESGFDVTIIANDTGKRNEIEKLGLKFINLPMSRTTQTLWREMKAFLFLLKIYRQAKPDIIHHVGMKVILLGGLSAKLSNAKGVVNAISGLGISFTGDQINSLPTKLFMGVLKYCHGRNNVRVIFQNLDDKKVFERFRIIEEKQSILIRGSGIDLDDFVYIAEPNNGKIKILLTARMIIEKGILEFIDSANLLRQEYVGKIQFILCGGIDENPKAISEKQLNELSDGEYVIWLGFRSDIKELLGDSHIVVLPSYYREGLPKSLIEAAATGRPIITTDSVGCRDAVIEDFNGYLVPIKNSRILADKLKILIDSPELRNLFGANSRLYAEREFSITQVLEKHLHVYSDLMGF
jgi:glycosyltransferase involved in cell wall biosynthesis